MAGKVTECALVPVSAFRRKGDAKRLPRFAISPPEYCFRTGSPLTPRAPVTCGTKRWP